MATGKSYLSRSEPRARGPTMLRTAIILSLCLPGAALALSEEESDARVAELLRVEEIVRILRDEGLAHSAEIAGNMFPDRSAHSWTLTVDRIYDPASMQAQMEEALAESLTADEAAPVIDFLGSDLGQKIVGLELSAREAYAEEAVEEAAKDAWALIDDEDTTRAQMIERFVEVNDLLEENVAAGLTANYEFLAGLNDGGAFPEPMSEDMMLAEAYSSEGEIRTETEEWLGSFLNLAYDPLTDAELSDYIAFSATKAGRDFNRALFAGFDAMYDGISRALGRAAAVEMVSQDI